LSTTRSTALRRASSTSCVYFMDLAAGERAQPGHDVAPEPAPAHHYPKTLPLDLDSR
jgi:hypothetical protein